MNSASIPVCKTGFQWVGIVLVAAMVGVGFAGEDIYQQGDSVTIIKQRGGSGPSESQVILHEDGQTIISRDGRNTDITVQRKGPFRADEFPTAGGERFERWYSEE